MDTYQACERCGLRAVRYELERRGIVLRFCDFCYWGEVKTDETSPSAVAPKEAIGAAPKTEP